jgi:hypothetical protein
MRVGLGRPSDVSSDVRRQQSITDRRQRRLHTAASMLVAALLVAGCSLVGDDLRPWVYISAPGRFSILAEAPTEITGGVSLQVERLELSVDGQPAGPPEEHGLLSLSFWRMPITRSLGEGIHHVRAVASGPAGTAVDSTMFAIGTRPFAVGFVPERLVVDRSIPVDGPVPAVLGIFGPWDFDRHEVQLVLEDVGDLTVDTSPSDAFVSSEPLHTGRGVDVGVTIDTQTRIGEHRLVVRADGPPGTEPQRATLIVEVVDGTATQPPAVPAPGAPHVETYQVRSQVTASDTPGVGNRASATWRLEFPCADGRCDAEVRDGGPRGGMDLFTARYVREDESYRFEAVQRLHGERCSEQRLTGQIAPVAWDARGPVRFRYRLEAVTRCKRSLLRVTWEGTGRRDSVRNGGSA